MKHTPGPWHAYKYPDTKSWTVASDESIASKIKTREDATLIAAAPDMLVILEQLDLCRGPEDKTASAIAIRDVIKKARGER